MFESFTCRNGHLIEDPDEIYTYPDGRRICRRCRSARDLRYREKHRDKPRQRRTIAYRLYKKQVAEGNAKATNYKDYLIDFDEPEGDSLD